MDVPDGTSAEVLDWVGDDPARAQAALEAEYAGANRSTLIARLQPIAAKEATMSETTAEETVEEAPAPEAPEPVVDLADRATYVGIRHVRDEEVQVPDDAYDTVAAEAREADEPAPVDAAAVEFFQVASSGNAVALRFDDSAVLLDLNQALALAQALRAALANVTY